MEPLTKGQATKLKKIYGNLRSLIGEGEKLDGRIDNVKWQLYDLLRGLFGDDWDARGDIQDSWPHAQRC